MISVVYCFRSIISVICPPCNVPALLDGWQHSHTVKDHKGKTTSWLKGYAQLFSYFSYFIYLSTVHCSSPSCCWQHSRTVKYHEQVVERLCTAVQLFQLFHLFVHCALFLPFLTVDNTHRLWKIMMLKQLGDRLCTAVQLYSVQRNGQARTVLVLMQN